jgi:Mlc titration factor MtfA (ptsG expression regulator)
MRPVLIYLIALAGAHLFRRWRYDKWIKHHELTDACPDPVIDETDHVLDGEKIHIGETDVHEILMRRFHYYQKLDPSLQLVFKTRLMDFIDQKLFIIKETRAVREMPVLVSAAAIQLTLGLKDYRLPFYKYIRIYKEEYVADHALKILAGNVRGNMISVAWNHVLHGYADENDGANLGLHEMSHALYFQKLVVEEEYAKTFTRDYHSLVEKCSLAHQDEIKGLKDFYSEYAETNLQEFWAESVELFFEKPRELYETYPDIFMAMRLLLNQDPLNPPFPIIESKLSFDEKIRRIADRISNRLNF